MHCILYSTNWEYKFDSSAGHCTSHCPIQDVYDVMGIMETLNELIATNHGQSST